MTTPPPPGGQQCPTHPIPPAGAAQRAGQLSLSLSLSLCLSSILSLPQSVLRISVLRISVFRVIGVCVFVFILRTAKQRGATAEKAPPPGSEPGSSA